MYRPFAQPQSSDVQKRKIKMNENYIVYISICFPPCMGDKCNRSIAKCLLELICDFFSLQHLTAKTLFSDSQYIYCKPPIFRHAVAARKRRQALLV